MIESYSPTDSFEVGLSLHGYEQRETKRYWSNREKQAYIDYGERTGGKLSFCALSLVKVFSSGE